MPSAPRFPRVVSLACHDLRTPLATVYGFARTLARSGTLDERSQRFVGMIEEAAAQMSTLLDQLAVVARIEAGRWEPAMRAGDTFELARSDDERIEVRGRGAAIETEVDAVSRALDSLAVAAVRFGPAERVTWTVAGRDLDLAPVTEAAGPVITGEELRDLGAMCARIVIEELGGSLKLDGERLLVRL
ncbi:MAG TPA: histidine kinase dimerization/phospho-acceptor domain-containing protein [Gaiellaceae bacterium]|nr:histidine kinase dimerization/phospho-acceptor domain-containing protein [Gaiellaceae bacterium]